MLATPTPDAACKYKELVNGQNYFQVPFGRALKIIIGKFLDDFLQERKKRFHTDTFPQLSNLIIYQKPFHKPKFK